MSQPVDREGIFRGTITEYGLKEMESGAVAVSIKAKLDEFYQADAWHPWAEYEQEAQGDIWVLKKDNGGPNDKAIASLVRCAGWDGEFTSITNETWKPTPAQFVVKREEYNGQTRFKIAFVNEFDRSPSGSMGNVDQAKAKELQARFGSQLRAIVGNSKRAAPPNGSPPAPPPKSKSKNGKIELPRATEDHNEPLPVRVGGEEDIPF